jgi:hypothetical protein
MTYNSLLPPVIACWKTVSVKSKLVQILSVGRTAVLWIAKALLLKLLPGPVGKLIHTHVERAIVI